MSAPASCNSASGTTPGAAQNWLIDSIGTAQGSGSGIGWNEYAFWLAVIIVYIFIGRALYSSGKTVALVLVMIGLITITLFYWFKWFRATKQTFGVVSTWPPVVSPCPDYMIETTTGSHKCYDNSNVLGAFSHDSPLDLTGAYLSATSLGDFCNRVTSAAGTVPVTWDGLRDGAFCMY